VFGGLLRDKQTTTKVRHFWPLEISKIVLIL